MHSSDAPRACRQTKRLNRLVRSRQAHLRCRRSFPHKDSEPLAAAAAAVAVAAAAAAAGVAVLREVAVVAAAARRVAAAVVEARRVADLVREVEAAVVPARLVEAEGDFARADREDEARVPQGEIFAVRVAAAAGEPDRDFATDGGLMGAGRVGGASVAGPLGRLGNSADETGITAGSSRLRGRYAPVRRRTAASVVLS